MTNNGPAPVAGVDRDPAAPDQDQSIDPAFGDPADRPDPVNDQSFDPVSDDPSAPDPLPQASVFGQLAGTITKDPITILVAQIHEEIEQILRIHRDIYDGIELATEQVQDKRIEFLEAGPEVTLLDIFVEVAFTLFLASPLLGNILRSGFRFIGAKAVASRVARLEKLKALVQPTRGKEADILKEIGRIRRQLAKNLAEQKAATTMNDFHRLSHQELPIQENLRQAQAKYNNLIVIIKQADTAQQKAAVDEERLKNFFKEANETIAKDYGLPVALATIAGARKSPGPSPEPVKPTAAPDSFGVQILSLAQFMMRNVEMYLGQAAADADMFRSIAQSEPVLRPDCFNLLSQMYAALQRSEQQETKDQSSIDARQAAMLEFEKLIWAMQMPQEPQPLTPADIKQIKSNEPEFGPGAGSVLGGAVFGQDVRRLLAKPPQRLLQYLKDRLFFSDDNVTTRNVQKVLNDIKKSFIEKSRDNPPIEIIKDLVFKSEPAPDSPTAGRP
jgi:hypothetical protein